jgi:hypothetical protein
MQILISLQPLRRTSGLRFGIGTLKSLAQCMTPAVSGNLSVRESLYSESKSSDAPD